MAVSKLIYSCNSCGAQVAKWMGQCPECRDWNSLVESSVVASGGVQNRGRIGSASGHVARIEDAASVDVAPETHVHTGINEFDRVLGGGMVQGAVVLLGGDPGIGKSTLLLQTMAGLAQSGRAKPLYVTGEETLAQIALRARRLGVNVEGLRLLTETSIERILALMSTEQPSVVVIDSIQTMYTDTLQSAPGSVAQVRESAARLVAYAKTNGCTLFLVGHVTKEGALAGPRVLEHMVDAVLYFESEANQRYRLIRSVKNRFGAANELGIFAMTQRGLVEVPNPSAIFLSRHQEAVPGSVITVTREGTRPLLVELQALVDESQQANPRRVSVGLDGARLAMLLAVLNRHAGISTAPRDVFVNIVGGVRVTETSADLPLLLAVESSLSDRPISADLVVFGEVGLAGEIRPVPNGEERLHEAAKHGFKRAIVPRANAPKKSIGDLDITPVQRLSEALEASLNPNAG